MISAHSSISSSSSLSSHSYGTKGLASLATPRSRYWRPSAWAAMRAVRHVMSLPQTSNDDSLATSLPFITPKISSRIRTWSVAAVRRSPASASGMRPHKAAKTSGVSTLALSLGPSRGGGSHNARAFLAPLESTSGTFVSTSEKAPCSRSAFWMSFNLVFTLNRTRAGRPSTKLPSFSVSSPQSLSSSSAVATPLACSTSWTNQAHTTNNSNAAFETWAFSCLACNVALTSPVCQVSYARNNTSNFGGATRGNSFTNTSRNSSQVFSLSRSHWSSPSSNRGEKVA
mmetsp:Transcript_18217/g.51909  ORF Transcript_18217/g.51909 Transcript_18217/m.51909 type:complete len:285 (-) Transcript_18217:1627-2481(-)